LAQLEKKWSSATKFIDTDIQHTHTVTTLKTHTAEYTCRNSDRTRIRILLYFIY